MHCNHCGNEYNTDPCPNCGQINEEPTLAASDIEQQQGGFPTEPQIAPENSSQAEEFPSAEPTNLSAPADETHWGVYCDTAPPLPVSEPAPPAAFCTGCGTPLNGANFCPQCGLSATASASAAPSAAQEPDASTTSWHTADPYHYTPTQPGGFSAGTEGQNPFTANYLYALQTRPQELKRKLSTGVKAAIIIGMIVYVLSHVFSLVYSFWMMNNYRTAFEQGSNSSYNWSDDWENDWEDSFNFDDETWQDQRNPDDGTVTVDPLQEAIPVVPDHITDAGESLYPNGISIAEFRQLTLGMTYAEASALIGGDGIQANQEETADGSVQMVWMGEYNVGAYVSIVFADQKLIKVEQEGLF